MPTTPTITRRGIPGQGGVGLGHLERLLVINQLALCVGLPSEPAYAPLDTVMVLSDSPAVART